ncbi:GRAM domain protein [Penicillium brasilianum]|uniref:GRAM domain protein n=1 Tax=Penicillium brasilianum TaxID=104259 RepID=A0A1S9S0C3_PENBI|nr:GRAM domain protein [Penicillium brasilianum]
MADSESSSLKGSGSRSRRAWTVSTESEAMDSSGRSNGRSSIDSNERPKTQGGESSAKAGSSGFSKLISSRRRRKKKNNNGDSATDVPPVPGLVTEQDLQQSRSNESRNSNSVVPSSNTSSIAPEGEAFNLLTDDSEPERTPPLTSHNSHTGFYTTSSPLIKTTSVDVGNAEATEADLESAASGPSATGSEFAPSEPVDTLSRPETRSSMTLDVPTDTSSKRRSSSPGRRLKDAFGSSEKKNANGNDDASSKSTASRSGRSLFSSRRSSLSSKRAQATPEAPPPLPVPIRTDLTEDKPPKRSLEASPLPNTPPHTAIPAPATTVTPPTPTEHRSLNPPIMSGIVTDSPESIQSRNSLSGPEAGITVSPSGNMISHRRVRSASAAHGPSKLSASITALSPLEESKTPKGGSNQQSGFFSSVFSVAQNAANSLSNTLNSQQKNRTTSQSPAPGVDSPPSEETDQASDAAEKGDEPKPSTVETLGTGDLNFSHLGIEATPGEATSSAGGVAVTNPATPVGKRKNTAVYQRDEAAAKLEDQRAARAVNMAYEKPESTGIGAPSDDILDHQSIASLPKEGTMTGDQTPPSGSILDGDIGSGGIKRSGSVRSRLARRHRGSSGATASTIGAIGASALALGVSGLNSSVPRLTGFAVASKKRNRDFHQLFRSVPEDDYLIEDYSCALQREIILAGRIYISEGHICFSSNILGWVTTLVISFDEVVAIEKENTAMVFPNAIAIQTLHARHTFRSLLSRESTYDLMVNIWKINHPSLKSSVNGTRVTNGTGDKTEKVGECDTESEESDEDEIYDEDEEGDHADSFFEAGPSANASERSLPGRAGLSRQTSGLLANATAPAAGANGNGEAKNGDKAGSPKEADFPGPATHAPTEYTEGDGQYEKVIKDEIIPAPLGKVYSLVFGPASGDFMTKFLVENQKSGELQFEGTAKGLTNESRVRKYSYIKPLSGSIGPRQTKCISTENLDFLDLDKAVLVTLSTQTPDVPSGNVFATKTKYLFTWAPGNQTRFLMTCNIEWTGKSWLKGPIEKGAIDGQTTFGTELVKALKAGVVPRGRTNGAGKGKGRRKKGGAESNDDAAGASPKAAADTTSGQAESWGLLEPIRPLLEPVTSMLKPLWSGNIAILIVGILLYMAFFRSTSSSSRLGHDVGFTGLGLPQRLAAYEEMWRREESELWNWLEDRVGMDGMAFPVLHHRTAEAQASRRSSRVSPADERDLIARLREEQVSDREMDHAIRTTRQRLDILEQMMSNRKAERMPAGEPVRSEL